MADYKDINLRDSLDDKGEIPSPNSNWWVSPDIIPYGTGKLTSSKLQETWTQDIGKPLQKGLNNIYLRGFNYKNGPNTGKIYLYYAPSSMLTHPSKWKLAGDPLDVKIDKSGIVAPSESLSWTPPDDNLHYCMVARIVTPTHPNPIPADNISPEDYANWVRNNPGVCHRNIAIVDTKEYDHQMELMLHNPENVAKKYRISAVCRNLPKGSLVTLSCPYLGATPPISKAELINKDLQKISADSTLVAHFEKNLTLTCSIPPNSKIPPGASINLKQHAFWTKRLDSGEVVEEEIFTGNFLIAFGQVPGKP